jgi:hypothetical protein
LLFLQRYGTVFAAPFLRRGASLKFKGELKKCPALSMVGDEKRLVLFHGLGQLLKVGLSELSRQEICPANASFTSASPLLPAAPITRTFIASSSCLVIWPPSKYAT